MIHIYRAEMQPAMQYAKEAIRKTDEYEKKHALNSRAFLQEQAMQIDKPGKYRMRNGDVAVVTAVCADHIWGYAENSDEKILRWWFADGRIMSNRDTHCDLIARIDGPDDPQPPKDKG